MALLEIKWRPAARELRRFACLWLPVFLVVVGGIVLYRGGSPTLAGTLWGLAGLSAILGAMSLRWAHGVYSTWMAAVYPVGWLVSHAVMVLVFFAVLTPTALILRILGRDGLRRQWDPHAGSYWRAAPRRDGSRRYFKLY